MFFLCWKLKYLTWLFSLCSDRLTLALFHSFYTGGALSRGRAGSFWRFWLVVLTVSAGISTLTGWKSSGPSSWELGFSSSYVQMLFCTRTETRRLKWSTWGIFTPLSLTFTATTNTAMLHPIPSMALWTMSNQKAWNPKAGVTPLSWWTGGRERVEEREEVGNNQFLTAAQVEVVMIQKEESSLFTRISPLTPLPHPPPLSSALVSPQSAGPPCSIYPCAPRNLLLPGGGILPEKELLWEEIQMEEWRRKEIWMGEGGEKFTTRSKRRGLLSICHLCAPQTSDPLWCLAAFPVSTWRHQEAHRRSSSPPPSLPPICLSLPTGDAVSPPSAEYQVTAKWCGATVIQVTQQRWHHHTTWHHICRDLGTLVGGEDQRSGGWRSRQSLKLWTSDRLLHLKQ